jgi:hypothetical protein
MPIFHNDADQAEENRIIATMCKRTKSKFGRYPKLFTVDGWMCRRDEIIAQIEVKAKTDVFGHNPDVMIDFVKWHSLYTFALHTNIPSVVAASFPAKGGNGRVVYWTEMDRIKISSHVECFSREGREDQFRPIVKIPNEYFRPADVQVDMDEVGDFMLRYQEDGSWK